MKKIISIFISVILITIPFFSLKMEDAEALFTECASNTLCFNKDVGRPGEPAFDPTSITAIPGETLNYKLNIWNRKSTTYNNVIVSDVLPAGITFDPGFFSVLYYPGSVNTSQLFSAGGFNFGSLGPNKYIEIRFRVKLSNSVPANGQTIVNTANLKANGGSVTKSDTANIVVSNSFPVDSGVTGYYYANKTLSCTPTFSRIDPVVNSAQISWPQAGGPGGGVGNDDFAVSWRGQIKSNFTENITLKTSSDDGVRVFFNGNLVIDQWLDRGVPVTKDSAVVAMTAGTWYNIRVDYYEHSGDSVAQLFWNGAGQTAGVDEIVPQQSLRQTYTENLNYGLTGKYFNSENPNSTAADVCVDQSSYYYFDLGAPRPGMVTDHFSVSWTGKVVANYNETYTFCTKADDGTRVWVDDNMIIDNFVPHTLQEDCGAIALTAGQHNIRIDYFDYMADSAIGIYWQSASQTGGVKKFIPLDHLTPNGYTGANYGLTGDYYSNMSLLGLPTLTRVDQNVNFDFGPLSPDGSIPTDNFSVKWTGKIKLTEGGMYNFIFYSDDGIRFRLNGSLLIDQWVDQTKTRTETGAMALAAGTYDIEINYFEDTGMGGVFFQYDTPSTGEIIVPVNVLTH